jgi:hypothetical protein
MHYCRSPIAIISRQKAGIFRHVGVLVPDGRVAHCAPNRGEHISTVEEFAAGGDVTVDRIVAETDHLATLHRIADALRSPKAYDPATNNCEIFANRVTGEEPVSPQLVGFVALLAIVAVLAFAAAQ